MHEVKEIAKAVLDFFNSVPAETWKLIIEVIVTAVGTSSIVQVIKRLRKLESDRRIHSWLIFFSLLGSAFAYLLTTPPFAPWLVFLQGGLSYGTSQAFYTYFLKPLFARLGAMFMGLWNKAEAVNEAKAATIPDGGIPMGTSNILQEDVAQ